MEEVKYFYFKKHILIILLMGIILQFSCGDNSTVIQDSNITYSDSGTRALVAIVENNDIVGFSDENLYSIYKLTIIPILSDIFSVPDSVLKPLSLKEVIEQYGEPWQIKQISESAKGYYDNIIILNNETAVLKTLIDTLISLKNKFTIDLLLNVHATQNSVRLTDGKVGIGKLTDEIKASGAKIRALYQTCCYGKYMIGSWRNIGVIAVNGAEGDNYITLFSPFYFINEWVSGKEYNDAVYTAYNKEIQKLKTYNNTLPVDSYLLNSSNLNNSIQSVGGVNIKLLWKECPVINN